MVLRFTTSRIDRYGPVCFLVVVELWTLFRADRLSKVASNSVSIKTVNPNLSLQDGILLYLKGYTQLTALLEPGTSEMELSGSCCMQIWKSDEPGLQPSSLRGLAKRQVFRPHQRSGRSTTLTGLRPCDFGASGCLADRGGGYLSTTTGGTTNFGTSLLNWVGRAT